MGGQQIIDLDRIEGFLHTAGIIGKRMREDTDFMEDLYLLELAEEKLGKETVRKALLEEIPDSNDLAIWFENKKLQEQNEKLIKDKASQKSRPLLKDIKTGIENAAGSFPGIYTIFGKTASEAEVLKFFSMLEKETRNEQLIRLLWIFAERELPVIDDRLLQLVHSRDHRLAKAAVSALSNKTDEKLHSFALDLLRGRNRCKAACGFTILANNYLSGNNKEVERTLAAVPESIDIDELHRIVIDCLKIAEKYPGKEMSGFLHYAYENSPCMQFRKKAVKLMTGNGLLTEKNRKECLFDGYNETRTLVNY